jgi:hypothetical protein
LTTGEYRLARSVRQYKKIRVRAVALAVLAILTVAGTALATVAAKPEKGATYRGTIKRYGTPISFTVSKAGKSVSGFKIRDAPFIFCQGGGLTMKSRSAAVSTSGTFKATLPLQTSGGKPDGQMTVTGSFANGGKEAGHVTVAIKQVPPGSSCNGNSSYSTKAG